MQPSFQTPNRFSVKTKIFAEWLIVAAACLFLWRHESVTASVGSYAIRSVLCGRVILQGTFPATTPVVFVEWRTNGFDVRSVLHTNTLGEVVRSGRL